MGTRGQAPGLPRRGARAWARPTPCSARATAAPSAGPTSSSGSSRPTAAGTPRRWLDGPRGRAPPHARLPRRDVRRRWTSTPCSPADPKVALVDELAHTNVPGLAQRQALAGRRGAPGRRHRRHHHGQHPAPRVAQRRRREDHRRPAARDGARRRRPRRRPDRARGHDRRGAAPPAGARQRLRAREGRRRAVELLPGRQPQRAARAGAAVDRRPGRRRPPAVPREARHHRHLGGPRAGRRRADRRPRGRDADPPGGPDRGPVQRRRPARRPRRPLRRARRRQPGRAGRAAAAWSSRSAAPTTRCSATTCPQALLAFARAENATQLVLGDSRRPALGAPPQPRHGAPHRSASPATSTSTSSRHDHTGRGLALPARPRQPQHPAQGRAATCSPSCCRRC